MDVVDILRKQRQEVTGVDIQVSGSQQAEPPWTWEEIDLAYVVRGRGLRRSAVERAIELSETKYCSVGATIEARCKITSTVRIVEEGDAAAQKAP